MTCFFSVCRTRRLGDESLRAGTALLLPVPSAIMPHTEATCSTPCSLGDAPLTFATASGVKVKAILASQYLGNGLIVGKDSKVCSGRGR